jgi:hypothetical protein
VPPIYNGAIYYEYKANEKYLGTKKLDYFWKCYRYIHETKISICVAGECQDGRVRKLCPEDGGNRFLRNYLRSPEIHGVMFR